MQLIINACFQDDYHIPEEFYENENRYYLTRAAEKFLVGQGVKGFDEKDE